MIGSTGGDTAGIHARRFIAIVGLPRSGTTWVGKLVDSAADVLYLHEPDYLKRIPSLPFVSQCHDAMIWEPFFERYLSELTSCCGSRSVLKRPQFPKSYCSSFSDRLKAKLWSAKLRAEQLSSRLGWAARTFSFPSGFDKASVLVWKTVEQTGNIGTMLRAIPWQLVVHVIRHPCGYIDSIQRGESSKRLQMRVAAGEDPGLFEWCCRTTVAKELSISLSDWPKLKPHERLAWIWLLLNEQAARDGESSTNYLPLYFDRHCLDPIESTATLFKQLGIDFDEQSKAFAASSSRTDSNGYFAVNRQSSTVPKRWEKTLSPQVVREILSICSRGNRMKSLVLSDS
jgi:hypothetical protein